MKNDCNGDESGLALIKPEDFEVGAILARNGVHVRIDWIRDGFVGYCRSLDGAEYGLLEQMETEKFLEASRGGERLVTTGREFP